MIRKHSHINRNARCPICYPEALYGTRPGMFTNGFQVKEPTIEILRNGDSWNSPRRGSLFRFGRVKTKMILEWMDKIQEFALSQNPGELIPSPIVRQPDTDYAIQLQSFPSFSKLDGIMIDEPYLRLIQLGDINYLHKISFGLRKSVALVIIEDELNNWLLSVRNWDG